MQAMVIWFALLGAVCHANHIVFDNSFEGAKFMVTQNALQDAPKRYMPFIADAEQQSNNITLDNQHGHSECNWYYFHGRTATHKLTVQESKVQARILSNAVHLDIPFKLWIKAKLYAKHCQTTALSHVPCTGLCEVLCDSRMQMQVDVKVSVQIHKLANGSLYTPKPQVTFQHPVVKHCKAQSGNWFDNIARHFFQVNGFTLTVTNLMESTIRKQVHRMNAQLQNVHTFEPTHGVLIHAHVVNVSMVPHVRIEGTLSTRVEAAGTGSFPLTAKHISMPSDWPVSEKPLYLMSCLRVSPMLVSAYLWAARKANASNFTVNTSLLDASLGYHIDYTAPDVQILSNDSLHLHMSTGRIKAQCNSAQTRGVLPMLLDANFENVEAQGQLVSSQVEQCPAMSIRIASLNTSMARFFLNEPPLPMPRVMLEKMLRSIFSGFVEPFNSWSSRSPLVLPPELCRFFPNAKVSPRYKEFLDGPQGFLDVTLQCICGSNQDEVSNDWQRCGFPCLTSSDGSALSVSEGMEFIPESSMLMKFGTRVSDSSASTSPLEHPLKALTNMPQWRNAYVAWSLFYDSPIASSVFAVVVALVVASLVWAFYRRLHDLRHKTWRVWTIFFGLPLCNMGATCRGSELEQLLFMCLVIVALFLHALCWTHHSPFQVFNEELFTSFSKNATHHLNVNGTVGIFQTWTDQGTNAMFCSACSVALLSLYRLFCGSWIDHFGWQALRVTALFLVLVAHLTILCGFPMLHLFGRELALQPLGAAEANAEPSSLLHLGLFFVGENVQIHDLARTTLSGSFTFFCLVYLAIQVLFFYLAIPLGLYFGLYMLCCHSSLGEATRLRTARCGILLIVITEIFTAIIAAFAFLLAYQSLGGGYDWILAAIFMLLVRPLWCLRTVRMAIGSTQTSHLNKNMFCFHFACVVYAVNKLIEFFDDGLHKFAALKVPKLFIASSMLATIIIVGVFFRLWLESNHPLLVLARHVKSAFDPFKGLFDCNLASTRLRSESIPEKETEYQLLPSEAGHSTAFANSRFVAGWNKISACLMPFLTLDALTSWTYHAIFIISEERYGQIVGQFLEGNGWIWILLVSGIGWFLVLLAFHLWGTSLFDALHQGFQLRNEFLAVGLMHWFLCLIRFRWQFQSVHSAIHDFHNLLISIGFELPRNQSTIFDDAYELFVLRSDWAFWSCVLSAMAFSLSMLFDLCSYKNFGRACSFAGGLLVFVGVLLPMSENYLQDVDVTQVCPHCAEKFDAMVEALGISIVGSSVSMFFCMRVFGFLVILPPTFVRTLFLMMKAKSEDAYGGDLRKLLVLVALLAPLATFFPIVSFLQMTESLDKVIFVFLFWTIPLLLVICPLICPLVNYSDTFFYVTWMIAYFGFFLLYCEMELEKQGSSLLRIYKHVDMPLFLSQMFANICFTNVVLSDFLYLLMEIEEDQGERCYINESAADLVAVLVSPSEPTPESVYRDSESNTDLTRDVTERQRPLRVDFGVQTECSADFVSLKPLVDTGMQTLTPWPGDGFGVQTECSADFVSLKPLVDTGMQTLTPWPGDERSPSPNPDVRHMSQQPPLPRLC